MADILPKSSEYRVSIREDSLQRTRRRTNEGVVTRMFSRSDYWALQGISVRFFPLVLKVFYSDKEYPLSSYLFNREPET